MSATETPVCTDRNRNVLTVEVDTAERWGSLYHLLVAAGETPAGVEEDVEDLTFTLTFDSVTEAKAAERTLLDVNRVLDVNRIVTC